VLKGSDHPVGNHLTTIFGRWLIDPLTAHLPPFAKILFNFAEERFRVADKAIIHKDRVLTSIDKNIQLHCKCPLQVIDLTGYRWSKA
jgi:hypothetical protein